MPDYRPTATDIITLSTTENRKVAYTNAMLSVQNEINEECTVNECIYDYCHITQRKNCNI